MLRQLEGMQREPSSQEMDIFEEQEMSKSWPQVRDELEEWYSWLVNLVPEPIKEKQVERSKQPRIRSWGYMRVLRVKDLKKPINSLVPKNPLPQ